VSTLIDTRLYLHTSWVEDKRRGYRARRNVSRASRSWPWRSCAN